MLDGFQRAQTALFFERRRIFAVIAAVVLTVGPIPYVLYMQGESAEESHTVGLADPSEIKDFAVEEQQPEEPEPVADEPPPPPPPNAKVERVKNPAEVTPVPEIGPPDEKPTEAAAESDKEKTVKVYDGATGPSAVSGQDPEGTMGGKPGGEGEAKRPAPPREPKPKRPKVVKTETIDPTKPVDLPIGATPPRKLPGNAQPEYPPKLREQGITGRYTIKLVIFRDGTVKGMKIVRKENTATGREAQAEADRLFLKAIAAVAQHWKFKPATLEGVPITVKWPSNIPFTLSK